MLADSPAAPGVADQLSPLIVHLGRLLVVATLLECALAIIFQWRIFRILFAEKAVKVPLAVLAALIIVNTVSYDPFYAILKDAQATQAAQGNWVTYLMSALVLAGGTAGVNRLFQAMGFRAVASEVPAPAPRNDGEAWISVSVKRQDLTSREAVQVLVEQLPNEQHAGAALAAVIDPRSPRRLAWEALLARPNRYPPNGGHVVSSNQPYVISVKLETGNSIVLHRGSFAPRAVVDFTVTI
ncbi:hypothetical protein [Bosea sp. BK604]|uniref:hypothetical protein n=1 Tax=Bosea sp. BK604 TaxID=2512180 RepID=UPI0010472198|nr:hypothetical protein [Bosea sp. BK604]